MVSVTKGRKGKIKTAMTTYDGNWLKVGNFIMCKKL